MNSRLVRSALAGALALLFVPVTVCAGSWQARGHFERTLNVSGPVELDVTTGLGNITVRTGEAASVRIVGTVQAKGGWFGGQREAEEKVRRIEADPPIEQSGNSIRIGYIRDRELQQNISISYELVVPPETRSRLNTGLGDLTIEGLRAAAQLETGAGNIRLSGIRAEARARTGLGNIELRGLQGRLRANTGSGNITVEGEPTDEWRLETGLGNVSVLLSANVGFDLYARTGMGNIETNLPLAVQGSFTGREVRGKVRGGGPRLDIQTGLGTIRID